MTSWLTDGWLSCWLTASLIYRPNIWLTS